MITHSATKSMQLSSKEYWVLLPKIQVGFLAPIWLLTTVCDSSYRGYVPFFQTPVALKACNAQAHMQTVHSHTSKQKSIKNGFTTFTILKVTHQVSFVCVHHSGNEQARQWNVLYCLHLYDFLQFFPTYKLQLASNIPVHKSNFNTRNQEVQIWHLCHLQPSVIPYYCPCSNISNVFFPTTLSN